MILGDFGTDIASGSSAALVAGGVTYGAMWVRTKVRELAHRGTPAEQEAMIAILDDQNATPDERAVRLTPLIEAHLLAWPDAVTEFKALTITGPTTYNQNNNGSGTFIGGSNHGGLTINHGGPTA